MHSTSEPKRALVSWSGGKDSCFAALVAAGQGYRPAVLLNVMNEEGQRSRSHGLPAAVLQAQAAAAGLPLHLVAASWQDYEQHFTAALVQLKEQYGLTHALFGDIDLAEHRAWEEKVCAGAGLAAVLPLWAADRKALVLQMIGAGLKTMIVSCNAAMGEGWLGATLTPALVEELEALGIDPCGEAGEFHTLVTDCPLFQHPLRIATGERQHHAGYWFISVRLAENGA